MYFHKFSFCCLCFQVTYKIVSFLESPFKYWIERFFHKPNPISFTQKSVYTLQLGQVAGSVLLASSFIYLYWIAEYYYRISYRRFIDYSQKQVSHGHKVSLDLPHLHGNLWQSRLPCIHPKLPEQEALELICQSPFLYDKCKINTQGFFV